jgi:DNA-binding transcriptional regulator YdaS (Cro superfamily)
MAYSEQVEKFRAWLGTIEGGASGVARELGVTRAAVSGWVLGRSAPQKACRLAIEALSGGAVQASDWAGRPRKKWTRKPKASVVVTNETPVVAAVADVVAEAADDFFAG